MEQIEIIGARFRDAFRQFAAEQSRVHTGIPDAEIRGGARGGQNPLVSETERAYQTARLEYIDCLLARL
jgi:hypothetical protein